MRSLGRLSNPKTSGIRITASSNPNNTPVPLSNHMSDFQFANADELNNLGSASVRYKQNIEALTFLQYLSVPFFFRASRDLLMVLSAGASSTIGQT